MFRPVGRGGAVATVIVQDRLQPVVARSGQVGVLVDDDPGHTLALVGLPDSGLGRMQTKRFRLHDRDQSGGAATQLGATGEGQGVGVAGIAGLHGIGQRSEPPIQ